MLKTPKDRVLTLKNEKKQVKSPCRAVRDYSVKEPAVMLFLVITLLDTIGSASHNTGFPFLAKELMPENPGTIMGYMISFWGFGTVVGSLLARRLCQVPGSGLYQKIFLSSVFLMSLGFIAQFNAESTVTVCLFGFLAGCGDGSSEVALVTKFQNSPESVRLPAFSLISMFQSAGFGTGMLIASAVMEFWSPSAVVTVFHAVPLMAVAFFLLSGKASASGEVQNSESSG